MSTIQYLGWVQNRAMQIVYHPERVNGRATYLTQYIAATIYIYIIIYIYIYISRYDYDFSGQHVHGSAF